MAAESNGKLFFFMSNLKDTEGKEYLDLMAVDPRGEGDITKTNILWRVKFPISQISSPLVVGGLLYVIDSRSNLLCIDARTGATVWSKKLRGRYNSSPVWAEGHIYISSSLGETYVIKDGRKYEMISCNNTAGGIWATPAFYRNSIILRSDKYLYKIR